MDDVVDFRVGPERAWSGGDLLVLGIVDGFVEVIALDQIVDGLKLDDFGQAGRSGADIELAGDDIGNQARAEFLDEGDFAFQCSIPPSSSVRLS